MLQNFDTFERSMKNTHDVDKAAQRWSKSYRAVYSCSHEVMTRKQDDDPFRLGETKLKKIILIELL